MKSFDPLQMLTSIINEIINKNVNIWYERLGTAIYIGKNNLEINLSQF